MAYRVEIAPAFARQFRQLPPAVQRRWRPRLDALAQEPRSQGVEKLRGAEDLYRLRVGDYRVIYQIQDDVLVLVLLHVGHRRDVYRHLP
jgi:mRNA interferase RelE/StbE